MCYRVIWILLEKSVIGPGFNTNDQKTLKLQLKKKRKVKQIKREMFKISLGQEKNREEQTIQRALEGRIKAT